MRAVVTRGSSASVTIDGTIPAYRPMGEVEEFIKSLG